MKNIIIVTIALCVIISIVDAKTYKGAEYRTKETFTYGRFEVCYKASPGPGQTATFFTYHELGAEGVAAWNEIDIEILGRYRNNVQFNTITPGQVNHVSHRYVGFNPAEAFHVYAFEWTPTYVAWFIDGEEVHRQTGDHIETLDRDQKIMMNIWPPAYQNWVGILDQATLPLFAYYDYVSYATHTPGNGNIGTDNNFTFQWKDDFDSWDQSRWAKASHTFTGNNCDFIPDNAVFQNGKLVLCLTDSDNTGYVDYNPPLPQEAWFDGDAIRIRYSEEVDKNSAENMSNYILRNGGIVNNITLDEYNREVTLEVSDYDTSVWHDIMVTNIQDLSATPNISAPKFLDIINPPVYEYPLKINVGGNQTDGFRADQEWDFEKNWGHISGIEGSTTIPIANTVVDPVYQTEIRDFVVYKVRVPKGTYDIKLMFSENYFSENDQRVFDVNVEGRYILRDLDVHKEAGKYTAHNVLAEDVAINDCIIDIHLGVSRDVAFLHGLEIEQISVSSIENETYLPEFFKLEQNYPNPFNGKTRIKYQLGKESQVMLSIYNILGQQVAILVNDNQPAGDYQVFWIPAEPYGVYVYQLKIKDSNGFLSDNKKMLYLK